METIGLVGLGNMGQALATRWLNAGFMVVGFDPYAHEIREHKNFKRVTSLEELASIAGCIWLMIPAGDAVEQTVHQLSELCKPGAVIIDGGNSFFKDSVKHAEFLATHHISFIDCGVSGGLFGKERGFALMIGGDKHIFEHHEALFKALAAPGGYAYVGPSGAGHYVKMVHNGIEYALLQAYAEGFHLLKDGRYKDLDLAKISDVWHHGAIIDSFMLELLHDIFVHDQEFKHISGKVAQTGMGLWTVREAHEQEIPVTLIEDALKIRDMSQKSGGNYSTKLVALLRNKFGGHNVEKL
jgi:6-phosphogluconate dehydrogenase